MSILLDGVASLKYKVASMLTFVHNNCILIRENTHVHCVQIKTKVGMSNEAREPQVNSIHYGLAI